MNSDDFEVASNDTASRTTGADPGVAQTRRRNDKTSCQAAVFA